MRGFALIIVVVFVSMVTSVVTVLGLQHLKLLGSAAAAPLPPKIGVPSLKGLSEEDARQNVKALGLLFLVSERRAAPGAAAGTVVEQSPAAGQQLEPRGSVSVTLARELPLVPSVVSRNLAEATALLARSGYKLEQGEPIADLHVPKGNVVSQLPEANAPQETDKPVIVRLSAGPAELDVPKLLGQSVDKVNALAKDEGFVVKILWTHVGETPVNVVLSQNPLPGKKIKPGETITVTINR